MFIKLISYAVFLSVMNYYKMLCFMLTNVTIDILHSRLQRQSVHERVAAADVRVARQHSKRARFAGAVYTEQTKAFSAFHTLM